MKKAIINNNIQLTPEAQDRADAFRKQGATHMLLVTDTFSYDDYYVDVGKEEDVDEIYDHYDNKNMQRIKWCIKL